MYQKFTLSALVINFTLLYRGAILTPEYFPNVGETTLFIEVVAITFASICFPYQHTTGDFITSFD
ncbi:hypothetical protein [Candidatus Binatus sp.]|uniref:hypothetical protein n=1 Tax=Candidatus Binatus sp. TaxID=2811406 RepID=UPI003C6F6DDF